MRRQPVTTCQYSGQDVFGKGFQQAGRGIAFTVVKAGLPRRFQAHQFLDLSITWLFDVTD
jgi:hypothetical protein